MPCKSHDTKLVYDLKHNLELISRANIQSRATGLPFKIFSLERNTCAGSIVQSVVDKLQGTGEGWKDKFGRIRHKSMRKAEIPESEYRGGMQREGNRTGQKVPEEDR